MNSDKIEMSEQDAINLLRYFEHAPITERNRARLFAIQVLQERLDAKKQAKNKED